MCYKSWVYFIFVGLFFWKTSINRLYMSRLLWAEEISCFQFSPLPKYRKYTQQFSTLYFCWSLGEQDSLCSTFLWHWFSNRQGLYRVRNLKRWQIYHVVLFPFLQQKIKIKNKNKNKQKIKQIFIMILKAFHFIFIRWTERGLKMSWRQK